MNFSWLQSIEQQLFKSSNQRKLGSSRRRRNESPRAAMVENLEQRQMLSAIAVTTLSDAKSHTGESLRDAIQQANADPAGDTINFGSNLKGGTITLRQGELMISNSVAIIGPGAGLLTISGNNASRIFTIWDGHSTPDRDVTIAGLTLTDGNGVGKYLSGAAGGAIDNAENLTLTQCNLIGNHLQISNGTNDDGGGAIVNFGKLFSSNNLYSGNRSVDNGGAIRNDGDSFQGGGIATSTNDTFTGNVSIRMYGGALDSWNGYLAVTADQISGNSSNLGGGGISSGYSLVITANNTFSYNSSKGGGGGLNNGNTTTGFSTNDTFYGNSAPFGGGINNAYVLTTTNDTITYNSASSNGGGVSNGGKWTTLNTIVAGNKAEIANTEILTTKTGQIIAHDTLVGDARSAGGIVNGSNGNIVGVATNQIFVTSGGVPVLAYNGGATATVALAVESPAIGTGGPLTALSPANVSSTATTFTVTSTANLVVGDFLKLGTEIVKITGISKSTVTVLRGQERTVATTHAADSSLFLACDQRGDYRTSNDIGAFGISV